VRIKFLLMTTDSKP